jgi:hypothetical protein
MRFVDSRYPLSELTRDVIARFYCTYDAFGFGFLEPVYRRGLAVERRFGSSLIAGAVSSVVSGPCQ